jgi:probable F420-dependent oxidoreductase
VRFLYQYPDAIGRDGDMMAAGRITEVAKAVEAHGLHGLAFTEHPAPGSRWLDAGGHQTLDPFVALGHAAAVTERIRLVTYLTVLPYRNPFLLGKAAATVDLLSNGRFTLGVGAGYQKGEFKALGVDFERRNDIFDESLEVLPKFWSGEPVSFAGDGFEAREIICRPASIQQPIPIWIGGNSQLTKRRVAESAQGWMPMLSAEVVSNTTRTAHIGDIQTLARQIAEVKDMADDRAASLEFLTTYPDHSIGSENDNLDFHQSQIGDLKQAGVTWLGIPGVSTSESQTLEIIEKIGKNYG